MAGEGHAAFRRTLEERYGFAAWSARAAAASPLRFTADPHALPALRLEERSALPGQRGHIDHLLHEQPGGRVAVTITEWPSVADAHDALLDLLGHAMAERLPSCEDAGLAIGDVCFCTGGEPVDRVWFTRANVLVRVESTGEEPVPVAEAAAAIDAQILAAASAAGS